jgi:cobalt/nickel transport system permease protein
MLSSLPIALHIPDGFLSGPVATLLWLLAILAVANGLRIANATLDESRVPLLGVLAAFIFAVQMLNFPVAGGTSGHLLGATLAAVLIGPWIACLIMAVVLMVQCFAFADGGVSALGANIVNMGVLGALLAGYLIKVLMPMLPKTRAAFLGAVGVASWVAVMVAAGATSVQLATSGTVPLDTVLPAMLGVHALIGIGEAVITVAAVSAVLASRPDLIALGTFDAPPVRADAAPAGSPS